MLGGGGGTGAARMFSSSHLPRMVGEVRVGYEVTAEDTAPYRAAPSGSRRRASRGGSGCRTRRTSRSGARAARSGTWSPTSAVPRCHGPPSADRRGTAPFPARSRSAGCRRTTETSCSHRASAATRCASAATGRRSCPPARRALADRRASVAPAASRTAAIPQLSARREIEQLVVRDAAPEKERQTRRELDIGEAIARSRRRPGRDRLRCGTGNQG